MCHNSLQTINIYLRDSYFFLPAAVGARRRRRRIAPREWVKQKETQLEFQFSSSAIMFAAKHSSVARQHLLRSLLIFTRKVAQARPVVFIQYENRQKREKCFAFGFSCFWHSGRSLARTPSMSIAAAGGLAESGREYVNARRERGR